MILLILLLLFCLQLEAASDSNEFCDAEQSQINFYKRFKPDEDLNKYDQEDPKLIEIIRGMIIPPAPHCQNYNFTKPKVDMRGQFGEADFLSQEVFGDTTGGFFIEAGAYDGEAISNTLFFEAKKKWTGLLVEANPHLFKQMVTKNRKAHLFGYCLSTKRTPEIVEFDASGVFGGIVNGNKRPGDPYSISDPNHEYHYRRSKFRLQCFPLYSILMALGNPVVDLFSLDIEGAEIPVLTSIPWDKVNIKVLVIEVHYIEKIFDDTLEDFETLMKESGYTLFKKLGINDVYIRNDFVPKKLND